MTFRSSRRNARISSRSVSRGGTSIVTSLPLRVSCFSRMRFLWRAGALAQQRLANRRGIQLARAEKPHETPQPMRQGLRKGLIGADRLLQPQAQDDERVGHPVEFAVEARDEA